MANGKIRFGKQSGGQLALVIPDGVTNTEVIVPESGVLAKTSDINTAGVELKTIATGTATFTATTNNINLTGIGVGLEIGDVIQISGANDSKNNSEFTVEVITNANNIIINQAHANKGTSKNVATRASDTGVTVKLLAKYYNAPLGLGQGWVDVTLMRTIGTAYSNQTNRTIVSNVYSANDSYIYIEIDGLDRISVFDGLFYASGTAGAVIPKGSKYRFVEDMTPDLRKWYELR